MTANMDENTALELEAQLDDYPEERGELLIEAADAWRRSGNHDRAIELLHEAIKLGDEDGGNARVALAEILFDLGRDDEARTQLDTLRTDRPPSPLPYHMAAELLEAREDLQEALTWFNMSVARLTEEDWETLDDQFGWASYTSSILAGRRRVRAALGMPPDETDRSVPVPPEPGGFLTHNEVVNTPGPREARVLFWPRGEVAEAHRRWPDYVRRDDEDEIMREREAANRELSDAGTTRVTMVPLRVAGLVEFAERGGGDPTDERTRHRYMEEIVRNGGLISWPPARNSPCWCGSGVKYKKCCGRPGR